MVGISGPALVVGHWPQETYLKSVNLDTNIFKPETIIVMPFTWDKGQG